MNCKPGFVAPSLVAIVFACSLTGQNRPLENRAGFDEKQFSALKFRNIGPFRGGRSNAVAGVPGDRLTYYFGSTGGGVWKTSDAGISWKNISDRFFKTGSVGAIAIAASDSNVIYVGTGEHAVRGVMTSQGDGVYKSTDAGKTWSHIGLPESCHISAIRVDPRDPDTVWVAVQGALYAPSKQRGVYKSTDGGKNWRQVLFVNDTTAAADLSVDPNNPRTLYAGMWDHLRRPWKVRSGGPGSGIHKSTDGGETWQKLTEGLPQKMGKVAVDVSPANSSVVYANIEADQGGVFRSNDGGASWKQTNKDRTTVARAWYYIEIFADPTDENRVYVLNAPMLRSIDGGQNFQNVANPHTDQHDLWINPQDSNNMILANDGGACITFNGGQSWSSQNNQPTAQFYRVITDQQFPYRIYGGQQDNSTVSIASRTLGGSIGERDWFPTAGGESAFLAFDPQSPDPVFGTSIQGSIDRHDLRTNTRKSIEVYPAMKLGVLPKDQKHRFNWNGPLAAQVQNPDVLYLGANVMFRTADGGHRWTQISGDLTRNDSKKHGAGGEPFTNEAAGGEVYNTISYIATSPHRAGTIWVGTDDGWVHRTADEGKSWANVTPEGLDESLINAIELSPHDPATAFIAVTRYKFGDQRPAAYKTTDNGKHWLPIHRGIAADHFVRVVRQDPVNPQVLYAGTEGGLYISINQGIDWSSFQSNLPPCPITDLSFQDNDLIVATSGRAFWVLDDLGAIQQSAGKLDRSEFKLFRPKTSYKFSSARNAPRSSTAGQNPLPGVIFDYQLPQNWSDQETLKLEIMDASGKTVRTISSKAAPDRVTWTGGPSAPPVLPAQPGLNRFHWDLRIEPLSGIENVFVMMGHDGPRVIPGRYQLRLSYADKETAVQVLVQADPRVSADPSDYALQYRMLTTLLSTAEEVHRSVIRMRKVKSQLQLKLKMIKEQKGKQKLVELGEKTLNQINKWEEKLIQPRQKTFQDVINFRNRFNVELIGLASQIDHNDPQPTVAAQVRLKELVEEWKGYQSTLEGIIRGSIAEFNAAYQKQKLPALIVPDKNERFPSD